MHSNDDADTSTCPGCGLELPTRDGPPSDRYDASEECWRLYGELTAETMSRNDADFVHQHCVDAYGAQHSGGGTEPITTVFALVGLYLAVEHGYSGTEVQRAHVALGELDREWPVLTPPSSPGDVTVKDVVAATPGDARTERIQRWAESVWRSWDGAHRRIRELCKETLDVDGR